MEYTVKQGDCLSSIAKRHGFARWRTIYDHPKNEAFRKKRPNPNVIQPGDHLHIPDKELKEVEVPATNHHKFRLKKSPCRVRLHLRDDEGQALAKKTFEIVVAGKARRGTTDDDGLVDERVPSGEHAALLRLWMGAADEEIAPDIEWSLDIGHLDPVEEVSGVQARLDNLGFPCGGVDGKLGPRTAAALRSFQHAAGLKVTGKDDDATRDALRKAHEESK